MNTPFFVTGYPRSRTAWMSVWLSDGPRSHCWHDGLRGCVGSDGVSLDTNAFAAKLTPRQGERVGDADSGLLFFHDRLRAEYPLAKWVLIERNSKEAMADFVSAFRGVLDVGRSMGAWMHLERRFAELRMQKGVLRVKFEDLDREDQARVIWKHVLPEIEFDARRWRQLNDLLIMPHPVKFAESLPPAMAAKAAVRQSIAAQAA